MLSKLSAHALEGTCPDASNYGDAAQVDDGNVCTYIVQWLLGAI